MRLEYFVVLGPGDEVDAPIIRVTLPVMTTAELLPADSFAFSRFFSIEDASPVPEPR